MSLKDILNANSKKIPNMGFSGSIIAGASINEKKESGSSSIEESTVGSTTMEDTEPVVDRSVKFTITRDDDGCKYAYENDGTVFNSTSRRDNIINNGFIVKVKDEDNKKSEKAKELIENRIIELELQDRTSSSITNRSCYGFSVTKKISSKKGDIIGLVDISAFECTPINDLSTGTLGGETGKGLDPDKKNKEVAIIQKGNEITYTSLGASVTQDKYFYFSNEEIITIGNNDRGMFKGVSDIMRSLRYVEIKKTLENVVDLVTRRFGPQVWVSIGNADYNLSTADIPQSYLVNDDGDLIDPSIARANYKNDVMTTLNTEIKKWVDGDSLVQLAEYGITPTVINPSSGLFNYREYIELMADFIKMTVLGLDIDGRTDVTSGVMQDKLTRDIRDKSIKERVRYIQIINKEITEPILKANGFKSDIVSIEFVELDTMDEERDVKIELMKSDAIYNYMKGGFKRPPEFLIKKWGFTEEDLKAIVLPQEKKEELDNDDDEEDNSPGARAVRDDLNRGR